LRALSQGDHRMPQDIGIDSDAMPDMVENHRVPDLYPMAGCPSLPNAFFPTGMLDIMPVGRESPEAGTGVGQNAAPHP